MSEFVGLIQQYLDRHGARWAAFARNIGVASQTVSKWKKNPGVFPEPEHLKRVAEVTGVPYLIVLDAVLKDAGYRESIVDDLKSLKVRIARYVRAQPGYSPRGDLEDFLNTPWLPDDDSFVEQLDPDMSRSDIDQLIDRWIDDADRIAYGNDELFDRDVIRDFVSDRLYDLRADNEDVDDPPITQQQEQPDNVTPIQPRARPANWDEDPKPDLSKLGQVASIGESSEKDEERRRADEHNNDVDDAPDRDVE